MCTMRTTRLHIDLETLSIQPAAAIISIGAASFEPGHAEPSSRLLLNVDFSDAMRYGCADGGTLAWWFQQSDATRLAVLDSPVSLENALTQLSAWISACSCGMEEVEIMANGPAFDCVILREMFSRVLKQPVPWGFRQERDYRTARDQLKRMLQHLQLDDSEPPRVCAHNALSDAVHQGTVIGLLENRLFTALER